MKYRPAIGTTSVARVLGVAWPTISTAHPSIGLASWALRMGRDRDGDRDERGAMTRLS